MFRLRGKFFSPLVFCLFSFDVILYCNVIDDQGCTLRPHTYMYSKKIDERLGEQNDANNKLPPHSKRSLRPPPAHEFVYRWFRGPRVEVCSYEGCRRRTSFNPIDWSNYALSGGSDTYKNKMNSVLYNTAAGKDGLVITSNIMCTLQCVSTQSSLYRSIFCNARCFVEAWRTQHRTLRIASGQPGNSLVNGANSGAHKRISSNASSWCASNADDVSVGSVGSSGTPVNTTYPSFVGENNDNDRKSPIVSSLLPTSPLPGSNTEFANVMSRSNVQGYSAINPYAASGDYDAEADDIGWVEISRNPFYVPTELDIGRKLSLEASAVSVIDGEVLMQRAVKTDLVLAHAPAPKKRNYITVKGSNSSGGGARFRIATYNALAEIYATQQQYPYCDFWALSWEYRFHSIIRELLDASADVICLQEVQADHYESYIYSALSDAGYEGVYKQKTRASMGLAGKVDGCALFWRRSKFHLVESYSIEMNELAQRYVLQTLGLNPRSEDAMACLNRLCKDNVAQLVVLELVFPSLPTRANREPINQVCIANTHLYSHKDYPDVKLWQTWQLLQELETFVASRGSLPLMICGDFNSTPDTAVYDMLSRREVHPSHRDVNMQNDDVNLFPAHLLPISHSFNLGSVYVTVTGEEPQHTNYTAVFKGVLDYMWYSATNLRPQSVASVPEEEDIIQYGEAMPSTQYSSDHVLMVSDMQILIRPP